MRLFVTYLWRFATLTILVGLGAFLLGRYRDAATLESNNEVILLLSASLFGALFTTVFHNLKQGLHGRKFTRAKKRLKLQQLETELAELARLVQKNTEALLFDNEAILREQIPLNTPSELFFSIKGYENFISQQLQYRLHQLKVDIRTLNTEVRNLNKALDVINQAMLLGSIHQDQYEQRINVLRGGVAPLIEQMKLTKGNILYAQALVRLSLKQSSFFGDPFKKDFVDALVQAEIASMQMAQK
jgi:hypothetical protein